MEWGKSNLPAGRGYNDPKEEKVDKDDGDNGDGSLGRTAAVPAGREKGISTAGDSLAAQVRSSPCP